MDTTKKQVSSICLRFIVDSSHICFNNINSNVSTNSCVNINPLSVDVPSFIQCNLPIEQYTNMLQAVSNDPESPNTIALIKRYVILRGTSQRIAHLKPFEIALNKTAEKVCLKVPQLIFYKRKLTKFANLVSLQ